MGRMSSKPRIALLWHQAEDAPKRRRERLDGIFRALVALGVDAEPIVYADETAAETHARILQLDGVLVWVNPVTDGHERTVLDAVLRDVAAAGVWVSAHPDVISRLGTKEVLYRTRTVGWGSDVHLYDSGPAMRSALISKLPTGPLVLKRARGHSGLGIWKVELADTAERPTVASSVVVEHAYDGATQAIPLWSFVESFAGYFDGGGCLVEQPFLARVAEGMVRAYVSGSSVVGFAEHLPRGFVTEGAGMRTDADRAPLGFDKVMHPAYAPAFRSLRTTLESHWISAMQGLLRLDAADLPSVWDADFIRAARTPDGDDRWVLCEINASCVSPFPAEAAEPIARTALAGVLAWRRSGRASRRD